MALAKIHRHLRKYFVRIPWLFVGIPWLLCVSHGFYAYPMAFGQIGRKKCGFIFNVKGPLKKGGKKAYPKNSLSGGFLRRFKGW